ncbi:unnamed protein product [Paramecium sonneborni]|uniref:Uncharacterized protein n=1 Tax=Paramecium sonneborni TaxID=65129 RepID=A0A8S1QVK9_9CILI|nr:unnamed protein product [Paramecium sonneborni]
MFQQKEFDYSQTPEVQQLYQEFVDAFEEKLIVEDFIPVVEAACGEQCSLLLKKLQRRKNQKLDQDEFAQQFNFELSEPENFDCIYEVLEQGKGKITFEGLKAANQKYKFGLTDQDMKIMMQYTNVKDQPITKSVFRQMIS